MSDDTPYQPKTKTRITPDTPDVAYDPYEAEFGRFEYAPTTAENAYEAEFGSMF